MIETFVRGLEVSSGRHSSAGGRSDLPMGGGGGYGTPASCYRCNKCVQCCSCCCSYYYCFSYCCFYYCSCYSPPPRSGHYARECPEYTGVRGPMGTLGGRSGCFLQQIHKYTN